MLKQLIKFNGSKITIGLVILISLFGLFGWFTGELSFAQINVLYIPIAPSTATSFILVSIVLFLFLQKRKSKIIHLIGNILLLSVIAFSAIVIFKWLVSASFDIENLFIKNPENFGEVVIGRMSPFTAILFNVESLAILFFTSLHKQSSKHIYGITVSISFTVSLILLLGYLYNVPFLYGGKIIPVALPTAICFLLLSIALIIATEFKITPFQFLAGNSIENKLVRAFLPLTLFLILLTGYVNSSVFVKFQNPLILSAVVMLVTLPVFGIIVISFAKMISKSLEEAHKTIKISEKKYESLIKASQTGAWEFFLEKEFVWCSEEYFTMLGRNKGDYDFSGEPNLKEIWTDLLHPDDVANAEKKFDEYLKNPEGIYENYFRLKHKNGEWISILSRGKLITDHKDNPIGCLGTHINISAQKSLESNLIAKNEKLKQSEQSLLQLNLDLKLAKEKAEESDNLKTEFFNNMSHEIRTPMNGILGFSDLLGVPDLNEEKRAVYIKMIQSSSQQLLQVIDDIIEISRLGTKQVSIIETEVCLNDTLFELFSIFDKKAKEIKIPLYLKKQLSDSQSTILTDKTKLNKILGNLLENALKFTNEGFVEFGYQLKNNEIEIYVKDTGVGIEKDKHKIIFDRFSQAEKDISKKVGGLGLGLSIAQANVELLGGRIQLDSIKGKGTTFKITIPYKPVNNTTEIEIIETNTKYSILIAEDEEVNYLFLETLLKDVFRLDCTITHVTNGKEAVEACAENKIIDLVLMDLKMPIMDGFEATKLIKMNRPNLPIIAQSAFSMSDEKEKAILAGCDDFILKPIVQKSLKEILDKHQIK